MFLPRRVVRHNRNPPAQLPGGSDGTAACRWEQPWNFPASVGGKSTHKLRRNRRARKGDGGRQQWEGQDRPSSYSSRRRPVRAKGSTQCLVPSSGPTTEAESIRGERTCPSGGEIKVKKVGRQPGSGRREHQHHPQLRHGPCAIWITTMKQQWQSEKQ